MSGKISKERDESWLETQERKAAEKKISNDDQTAKQLEGMKAALILVGVVFVGELIVHFFGGLQGENFQLAMICDAGAALFVCARYLRLKRDNKK